MRIISTPFQFRGRGYLGNVYRPYLKILTSSQFIDEWIPIEVIVDTGADYTLLPKSYAQILLIDLHKDCFLDKTFGVGGQEGVYLYKSGVKVKINNWNSNIPVGFLDRNDVPALLGRLDCLEILGLVMKDRNTTLEE